MDGNNEPGDAMRILICNERFLFRFGLDRVLIMIGKGMAERGNDIYMMGCRCDEQIVGSFTKTFIPVPPAPDDYANSNEFTAQWLESQWDSLFTESEQPDIVIIGGWPFFQAIEFFSKVCKTVVFIDPGAVPLDGFVGHSLFIQQKLRDLRRRYLSKTTGILPISQFIANSQSIVDRGCGDGIQTVLLGANHMEISVWQAQMVGQDKFCGTGISLVKDLNKAGRNCILNLGRWEPGCYKNSEACFDIMRRLVHQHPQAVLLVLAEPSNINIPLDLTEHIKPIGFPDDAELQEIMKSVSLGISVSLWEGFNLPLAEMQWLQKPALAFDLAAHPEVIVHPWFLCTNSVEMVAKADCVLSGKIPQQANSYDNYDRFRSKFRWETVVQNYCRYFENAVYATQYNNVEIPILIIDITNSCRDPANSGVIRVTRQLCRMLQKYCDPVFVVWDFTAECYRLPSEAGYLQLSQFNGPKIPAHGKSAIERYGTISLDEFFRLDPATQKRPALLFFPETILDQRTEKALVYAQQRQWKTAAVLYDLIPIIYPELCSQSVSELFPPYLVMLSSVDVIVPISEFSAKCVINYWQRQNIFHGKVTTAVLPGEFGQHSRDVKMPLWQSGYVHMLCVSTLEPRKNHLTLLKACEILAHQHPELDWHLTLVGNRYEGAPDIYEAVQKASANDSRIQWLGVVDDATLHQLYEKSTFTIYSSLVEGFGMPILESIWHGRICLCHCEGVMAELAEGGGCMVVDMKDANALAQAIYTLSTDQTLFVDLSQAAIKRNLKTWDDYTQEVLAALNLEAHTAPLNVESTRKPDLIRYQDLLYPNCLLDGWQMSDSERMAMTGLLARHQPKCSVEIGTCYGGSLSLIAQYSAMVFSIDIDPEVPLRVPTMENVSFLTGQSTTVLPLLFTALDEANIPVDFALIDGNRSADDVRRNIETILTYVPQQSMFVAIHGSFNPECRHGIRTAKWQDSPYVLWVDVDFIPGRVMESQNSAKKEMLGGLALALLSPTPRRQANLTFEMSANSLYELALNSLH